MSQSIKLGSGTFLEVSGIDGWCRAQLPSNANADNYNTAHDQGWYYVGDNANMTNIPTAWAFLLVVKWGIVMQILIHHKGNSVKIRGFSNGSWGAWKTLTPT